MGERQFGVDINLDGNKLLNKGEETIAADAVITPAVITINTNNYEPAGVQSASIIRASSSSHINITGIIAPDTARWKQMTIYNVGTNIITLVNNSALSVAQNRMLMANNTNIQIPTNGSATLIYDQTSQRWRVSRG